MPSAVRASILAAVTAAAALLSACGSSGSPTPALTPPAARTLASEAISAFRTASSVRVSGFAYDHQSKIFMDLAMTRSGGLSGTFAEGSRANQFIVLDTGGKVYFKFTPGFAKIVKAPPAVCQLMCGRWLLATPSMTQGFLRSISWSSLVGKLAHLPLPPRRLKVHGPVQVNKVEAWVITDPRQQGALYVAAHGTPYMLRFTKPGSGGGKMDFTDWNSAKIPAPPPAKDVINMSQLSKLG